MLKLSSLVRTKHMLPKISRARLTCLSIFTVTLLATASLFAQSKPTSAPGLSLQPDGTLRYTEDKYGNRIPDFSFCGYKSGSTEIPDVPVKIIVPLKTGDATERIQAAIDYVSSLPKDKNGFRGAVILQKGTYHILGSIHIHSSGVVLRGHGIGKEGTQLVGEGNGRETLIRISGMDDRKVGTPLKLISGYIPVNAITLHVPAGHSLKPGDFVYVHRPSTKRWIELLGMQEFGGEETQWLGWKPGQRDLFWDRQIRSVEETTVTLDAPLTSAIDSSLSHATIKSYQWSGRIEQVGVENLSLESTYDNTNLKDENHRWMAITMEQVRDAWVRQVTFSHFAGSAVALFETASRVTVEDCLSTEPVSEIGGQRRNTFFTSGQQNLFQRLYTEHGYHDFAVGFCAPGPNAFVQCESHQPFSFSGTIDSWATGVLFDNVTVDGHQLGFSNRMGQAHGAGWTAANSVLWQCAASQINCFEPPTAYTWAFGSWGEFSGNGQWYESNNHVSPRSLFYAQREQRFDHPATNAFLLPSQTEATSSPTLEQAASLMAASRLPGMTLKQWILDASKRHSIPVAEINVKSIDEVILKKTTAGNSLNTIVNKNGWLVDKDGVVNGKRWAVSWWRGDIRPYEVEKARPHITRFVPGRTGIGLTDDLNEVIAQMKQEDVVAIEHNYGLWYDRRRDDHQRVRRGDGDVWPPFYELPFARTGKEMAWDGLSLYDLTQYNPWYWDRLKKFADLADEQGVMLIHKNYFQHNILEAGAHWADSPWRPANNVNETGFPEPPPYAGDKRIFMAGQFYDITHPVRRKLHRDFIRKCLSNFSDNTNVIQIISEEYTGPLHFVQFWLDVITEWEKENSRNALVALSTTKDVQDEILKDPVRSKVVDIVDIRYWFYQRDGKLIAPEGGKNLAPRQHARILKPGGTSFEQVYNAVLEYKNTFPDKAVMYSAAGADEFAWATFMAGGSLSSLPTINHRDFTKAAEGMRPLQKNTTSGQWALGNENGLILYSRSEKIDLSFYNASGKYTLRWINPADGKILREEKNVSLTKSLSVSVNAMAGAAVVWISRN